MIQITDKKEVISTTGKYVHRIGTDTYFKRCIKLPNDTIDMFEEVESIPEVNVEFDYKEEVVRRIREKYSIADEIAILRQQDIKPDEYQEWYAFCESVKQDVKEEMKNNTIN